MMSWPRKPAQGDKWSFWLHAKIGELTLENDFLEGALTRRFAERKATIDRQHDLPTTSQAEVLRISRGSV
jgi:hypothetical protein